jgi:hypothetical protein
VVVAVTPLLAAQAGLALAVTAEHQAAMGQTLLRLLVQAAAVQPE